MTDVMSEGSSDDSERRLSKRHVRMHHHSSSSHCAQPGTAHATPTPSSFAEKGHDGPGAACCRISSSYCLILYLP
jgi:hypothetical protein